MVFVSRVYVLEKDTHFKLLRTVLQTNTNSAEEEARKAELSRGTVGTHNGTAITAIIMVVTQKTKTEYRTI